MPFPHKRERGPIDVCVGDLWGGAQFRRRGKETQLKLRSVPTGHRRIALVIESDGHARLAVEPRLEALLASGFEHTISETISESVLKLRITPAAQNTIPSTEAGG